MREYDEDHKECYQNGIDILYICNYFTVIDQAVTSTLTGLVFLRFPSIDNLSNCFFTFNIQAYLLPPCFESVEKSYKPC